MTPCRSDPFPDFLRLRSSLHRTVMVLSPNSNLQLLWLQLPLGHILELHLDLACQCSSVGWENSTLFCLSCLAIFRGSKLNYWTVGDHSGQIGCESIPWAHRSSSAFHSLRGHSASSAAWAWILCCPRLSCIHFSLSSAYSSTLKDWPVSLLGLHWWLMSPPVLCKPSCSSYNTYQSLLARCRCSWQATPGLTSDSRNLAKARCTSDWIRLGLQSPSRRGFWERIASFFISLPCSLDRRSTHLASKVHREALSLDSQGQRFQGAAAQRSLLCAGVQRRKKCCCFRSPDIRG